jgi:ABC-type thiamine transport system substrate-binding protein
MYPVLPALPLPESYRAAVKPVKTLEIDPKGLVEDAVEAVEILSSGK